MCAEVDGFIKFKKWTSKKKMNNESFSLPDSNF